MKSDSYTGMPLKIIMQKEYAFTRERSAVVFVETVHDIEVDRVSYDDLLTTKLDPYALPIGSVEFVRRYMSELNINEPDNISYPESLRSWRKRDIRVARVGDVIGEYFVKPVETKLFTGFVFNTMLEESDYGDSVDDYKAFMSLHPSTLVYLSEVVKFNAEFRIYVYDGTPIGHARYDGHDNDLKLEESVIDQITHESEIKYGSIDVGILDNGEICLVECNDAWALGLYPNAISDKQYIGMLNERWREITSYNPKTSPEKYLEEDSKKKPKKIKPIL